MLLFFWQWIAVLRAWVEQVRVSGGGDRVAKSSRGSIAAPVAAALGAFVFVCLPNPIARAAETAPLRWREWVHGDDDDLRVAARWVSSNTPPSTVVVAPPWRRDVLYFAKCPIVASWSAMRYDAMSEWRERIEALAGDTSAMKADDNQGGAMDDRSREFYEHLSLAQIAEITRRFGGDVLLTTTNYPFPLLFKSGKYSVYKISVTKP